MNDTLINFFQQNRLKKAEGKRERRKKITSGMVVNEEMLQEEQQLVPSRQRNNLTESLNDESMEWWVQHLLSVTIFKGNSFQKMIVQTDQWWRRWRRRWWYYYLQNLQDPLDRIDVEMQRLGSMQYMRWIYLLKVLWQERYFANDDFFVVFKTDNFHSTAYSGAYLWDLEFPS